MEHGNNIKTNALSISELKNAINTFRTMFGDDKALNKCAVITKRYFTESSIYSISVNEFSTMTDLTKEYAQQILLKLNSDYFKNKQGA